MDNLDLLLQELYHSKRNKTKVRFTIQEGDKNTKCSFIPENIEYHNYLSISFKENKYITIHNIHNYQINMDSNGCNSYSLYEPEKKTRMVFVF